MSTKIAYYGLALYEKPGGIPFSYNDLPTTKPFRITMNGLTGGCLVRQVFLRNDNPSLYYTDVSISIVDASEGDLYTLQDNWSWKLIYSIHEPTPEEWDQVAKNNSLSFASIGTTSLADTFSYFPIWIQCNVPAGLREQNILDLSIFMGGSKRIVGY